MGGEGRGGRGSSVVLHVLIATGGRKLEGRREDGEGRGEEEEFCRFTRLNNCRREETGGEERGREGGGGLTDQVRRLPRGRFRRPGASFAAALPRSVTRGRRRFLNRKFAFGIIKSSWKFAASVFHLAPCSFQLAAVDLS